MFEDIFGPLDDITKKPAAPEQPEGWDTGIQTPGSGEAWDTGQRENVWRSGQQFWDTGQRTPHPVFGPASQDPSEDPDYDPDQDYLIEDDLDDLDDDPDDRW